MDTYSKQYRPVTEGARVALAPHLDLWMAGVRYGTVLEENENEAGERLWMIRTDADRTVFLREEDLLGAL